MDAMPHHRAGVGLGPCVDRISPRLDRAACAMWNVGSIGVRGAGPSDPLQETGIDAIRREMQGKACAVAIT
jgi:hypothetical protein